MFKSARWRNDKNKIKTVFKLQFYATQVNQRSDGLMISVVPGDVGKSTGKTEKGLVIDGVCRWESPVYETVKFVQDVKTKKVNRRIYHLIVSTTTGSNLVGKTSIDFADYFDSIKTCDVSLPLSNSNSKVAILHVSIERQLENDLKEDETIKSDTTTQEEGSYTKSNRINELRRRASIESNNSTLSSFDSVSELDHNPIMHHHRSITNVSESEWSDQGISSTTDDSTNSSNDTILRDNNNNNIRADEIDKLKAELIALTRRLDLSELELQSLRKQIVKETKRSQDLLKEVTCLKQERDLSTKPKEEAKKAQESNTEIILTVQDHEAMLGERSNKVIDLPRPRICDNNTKGSRRMLCTSETDEDDEDQKELDELVKGHMDAKETYVLEQKITDLYNDIEIYKRDKDDLEIQMEQLALDYEILKQENHDISYKLEQSQVQEQLKMMQYECCCCSSSLVENLEAKVKKQSEELSESLCRIKDLETVIKCMEEELEKQAEVFEEDIEVITIAKVEQEQRAIKAEEALRKTRLKNANVASKIQQEFKRISEKMSLRFEENEKMSVKAMAETHQLRMQKQKLEEVIIKANNELRELLAKTDLKTKEMERMLEDQKRQEEDLKEEITRLKDEIEILRVELKHKEQVVQVKSELKKKEEEMANVESGESLYGPEAIASLREQNELIEMELKEMQERYSEISVRFAEVEGERQKLVMTVRYLKNIKKT